MVRCRSFFDKSLPVLNRTHSNYDMKIRRKYSTLSTVQKSPYPPVTTMLAISKMSYFQFITTGADDPTL